MLVERQPELCKQSRFSCKGKYKQEAWPSSESRTLSPVNGKCDHPANTKDTPWKGGDCAYGEPMLKTGKLEWGLNSVQILTQCGKQKGGTEHADHSSLTCVNSCRDRTCKQFLMELLRPMQLCSHQQSLLQKTTQRQRNLSKPEKEYLFMWKYV